MRYVNKDDIFLFVGQNVLWYPDGDQGQEPHAGKVMKVSQHTVCLITWAPGTKDARVRDGVRHLSDPAKHSDDLRQMGCWEHNPQTKMLQDLTGVVPAHKAVPKAPAAPQPPSK